MKKEKFSCTKCCKCGKVIAVTYKIDTNKEYQYIEESTSDAFIDKWGYRKKYCKHCME